MSHADDVLKATTQAMQELLWKRQRELWPRSERLSVQEVIEWALEDHAPNKMLPYDAAVADLYEMRARRERRLRAISMALQYPICVWYHIPGIVGAPPDHKVTGCRVGFDGSDYLSNFSDL